MIAICVVTFVIEFFADKIPPSIPWNALHTFVRPGCALLAYGAAAHLSPLAQAISGAAGGAIALAAHGGKNACHFRFVIHTLRRPLSRR